MPVQNKAKPPEVAPFDPDDREEWRARLQMLPLRAVTTFAMRCAKRVEPFLQLRKLEADAYSAGIKLIMMRGFGSKSKIATAYSTNAAYAAIATLKAAVEASAAYNSFYYAAAAAYSAYSAANSYPDDSSDVDASACVAYYDAAASAAFAELTKLLELKLGKPGEPGEPIRWNDARLGPLWPDGEPESYTDAVKACRELEDQLLNLPDPSSRPGRPRRRFSSRDDELRNLPDPTAAPDNPLLLAQLEDWAWLDQLRGEGKLDQYRGEYVFAAGKQIFGHGRNLVKMRPRMEKKAQAKGISPERLLYYFVPRE